MDRAGCHCCGSRSLYKQLCAKPRNVLAFILNVDNPDRGETLSHLERGIPIDDVTPDKMGARPLKYNATLISSIEIGSLGVAMDRESRKDPIGKLP